MTTQKDDLNKYLMIQPLTSLKTYLIIVASMFFIVQNNYAQNNEELVPRVSYWEFGFSGGVSKFIRTTNPSSNAVYKNFNYWDSNLNMGVSLSATKHISPVFSLEFDYLKTTLSGDWDPNNGYPVPADVIARGLATPPSFKTGINQVSLLLNTNLNKLFFPKLAGDIWYLYFNGGVGYSLIKYKKGFDLLSGNKSKGMVLYGPGISFKFDKNIKFFAGLTRYIIYTDRLDALSTLSTDSYGSVKSVLNTNERYNYSYIGITYRFDQRDRKPGRKDDFYYKPNINRSTVWNRFFKHIF